MEGYQVHSFDDSEAALQHIQDGCADCKIIISDIKMPKLNGFQLVRKIREIQPDMSTLMITAFEVNMVEFRSVFPTLPVDQVLRKPFVASALVKIVSSMLPIQVTEPSK